MTGFVINWAAAIGAAALCILMAVAESKFSDPQMQKWFVSLRKPRFFLPMWAWIIVAFLTYVLQGVIAYRLLVLGAKPAMAALLCLAGVMACNVIYNVVLARGRSPRFLYTGIARFIAPLLALQALLLVVDPVSAAINAIYVGWVVLYDLPIMRATWKLNS